MKKVLLITMTIILLSLCSSCSLNSNINSNSPRATEDKTDTESVPSSNNKTNNNSDSSDKQDVASGNLNPTVPPSVLENVQESDNNLANLQKQGLEVIEEQSFEIELENWGKVRFIAGEMQIKGYPKLYLYLTDLKDNILYGLPEFYGNMWILYELKAISFEDANKDGLKDIIIVADYILGHGVNAADPFPVGSIYFQKDKEFVSLPELDKEINEKKQNESIDMILKFVEGKDIKLNQ